MAGESGPNRTASGLFFDYIDHPEEFATHGVDEYGRHTPEWRDNAPLRSPDAIGDWIDTMLADGGINHAGDIEDLMTIDELLKHARQAIEDGKPDRAFSIGVMIGMYAGRYEARPKHRSIELGDKASERGRKGAVKKNAELTEIAAHYQSRVDELVGPDGKTMSYAKACEKIADEASVHSDTIRNNTTNRFPRNQGRHAR